MNLSVTWTCLYVIKLLLNKFSRHKFCISYFLETLIICKWYYELVPFLEFLFVTVDTGYHRLHVPCGTTYYSPPIERHIRSVLTDYLPRLSGLRYIPAPVASFTYKYGAMEGNNMNGERTVARPMYINLYHFIMLILIIHVLWYDTGQVNDNFFRKVIDKRTKIESIHVCCRGGGLKLCPLTTSVFPELKMLKFLPP